MDIKKTNLFFLVFAAIIMAACSQKSNSYKQLVVIDSLLLEHNMDDTAVLLLRSVEPRNQEDTAYYNILMSAAEYDQDWKIKSLDPLNYSIDYYTTHPDNLKLANAYYYKAMIDVDHSLQTQETVLLLKDAEKLAEETSDNTLKNKIYSALAYSNGFIRNYEESLKYAKKEYYYAKKLNNNRDIAYGLLRLSTCYKKMGIKDSSGYYIEECNKLAQYINDDDKAFVYSLLGESFMRTNADSAQKYLITALKYKKMSSTYYNLMEIYFAKNDTATAKRYCDSALMLACNKKRIAIYSGLAQKYYNINNIEDLKRVTDKIISTYDEILLEDQNKFLLEMQRKFDFEKQQIVYTRNVSLCISAIVVLCAICVVLHLRRKHERQIAIQKELEWENRNLQLFNDLCETKRTITDHELQIKKLETENSKLNELSDNQEYINTKKHIAEVLEIGRNIYHKIENNECIANDKDFWVHCLFYSMYSDANKVKNVFNHYRNLSIDEKIFVMVDESFSKKDDDVAEILNISPVTVRTRRSKLKTKLA